MISSEQMAQSAVTVTGIEKILGQNRQCGICKKSYECKKRIPILLPCWHSFCLECLNKHWQKNRHNLACQKCLTEYQVKNTIERSLPVDVISMKILKFTEIQKESISGFCKNCPRGNKPTEYCFECERFLCDECRMWHNNFLQDKGHFLCSVQQIFKSPVIFFHRIETCIQHSGSKLELFCNKEMCKVPLCQTCAVVGHKERDGHNISYIKDVYDARKNDMLKLCENIQMQQQNSQKDLEALQVKKSEIETNTATVTAQINLFFDKMYMVLAKRKELLTESLGAITEEELKQVLDEEAAVEQVLGKRQEGLRFFEQVVSISSSAEFLSLSSVLQDKLNLLLQKSVVVNKKAKQISLDSSVLEAVVNAISFSGTLVVPDYHYTKEETSTIKPEPLVPTQTSSVINIIEIQDFLFPAFAANVVVHCLDIKTFRPVSEPKRVHGYVMDNKRRVKTHKCAIYNTSSKTKEIKFNPRDDGEQLIHVFLEEDDLIPDGHRVQCCKHQAEAKSKTLYFPKRANTGSKVIAVKCPSVLFSTHWLNTVYCSISDTGVLINKDADVSGALSCKLKQYPGSVSSIPIQGRGQHFWTISTKTKAMKKGTVWWAFEVGVAHHDDIDISYSVGEGDHGWCVRTLTYPNRHELCFQARWNGQTLFEGPICALKDSAITVEFGFLLDLDTGRMFVIDITRKSVLYTFEKIDVLQPLWPMACVCERQYFDVSLAIASGPGLPVDDRLLNVLNTCLQ